MSEGPIPHIDMGHGPALVLLHGYAMAPDTYLGTARLLAERTRVLIPDLFALGRRWTAERCVDTVLDLLDRLRIDRATFVAHSFGGGIQLALATRQSSRVEEMVFADTLGLSREWVLAREAVHPTTLMRLATVRAAVDFARTWGRHAPALIRAAWWGFTSDRRQEVETLAQSGIPSHVLWAERDTLLSRDEGRRFAQDLRATFDIASGDGDDPIDHDWMYRHPQLFVRHLETIGLAALR